MTKYFSGENQFNTSNKKASVVDTIINRITDDVLTGKLHPGDQLPTEIQLAEMMNVSKNTVREAIKILVAYGVVEIRRPEGTFITDGFSPKTFNPLIYNILFTKANAKDLLGIRRVVDSGIMMLILENGLSPEDTAALEEEMSELAFKFETDSFSSRTLAEEDAKFHRMLASATHNDLLQVFHDFLMQLTQESRVRSIERCRSENNMQYLIDVHRETLDVIERKSEKSISDVIDFSFLYWKDTYDV